MKHNLPRRVGALFLALFLALPLAAPARAAEGDEGENPPAGLTIDVPAEIREVMGTTGTFHVTSLPPDVKPEEVRWITTNPEVIAVSAATGYYTVKSAGKTTITAAAGVYSASQLVEVTDPAAFTAELKASAATVQVGEPVSLSVETVSPNNSARITRWSTSGRAVVTETGPWTAEFAAQAVSTYTVSVTVAATGLDGKALTPKTLTCTIRVADLSTPVTSLTLTPAALSLSQGATAALTAAIQPAAARDTPIYWSSDNSSAAAVDQEGRVYGMNPGHATITASAGDQEATCRVTVLGAATGIRFAPSGGVRESLENEGWVTQFDASDNRTRAVAVTVASSGGAATNTYVNWTSSDTSVVTVTPGRDNSAYADLALSPGRRAGKAIVTATVYDATSRDPVMQMDGRTPICAALEVTVSGITLSESELTLYEGQSKTLMLTGYGEAIDDTAATVEWSSSDGSIASSEGGSLSAWSKGGPVTITARSRISQDYTAACSVTVADDPGTIVSAGSASAGNAVKLGTSSVISQLNSVARQRTGAAMDYITAVFISPSQGVVYNTYTSEADTGAGVSMSERYYVNRSTPAAEYVGALSFVPSKTFSGEARISYTGYSNGQPIAGVISVSVSGMGEGTGDVTYTSAAAPVTFQAEDFNIICGNKTGRALKYVTFTPPDASRGTLYEGYVNDAHPGQKVVASTRYNRTGTPSLNSVTFVPAEGFQGTATITYRAVDAANSPYTGKVTITVSASSAPSDPADIYYTAPQDGWAVFRAADFANASLRTIGETLSHVRFTPPPSSDGTLFYNYKGFGDYESGVASTTSYYYSGNPALGSVAYVPATTAPGQSVITYTGYSTRGTTFTGRIYVTEGSGTYQPGGQTSSGVSYNYAVNSGSAVTLRAGDFNSACQAATGATLSYIRFTALPASGQGTLRCRSGGSSYYSSVSTYTSFYYTGTSSVTPLISDVSFLASASYTGVVTLPYTGYSTLGSSFTGAVTIQVNPNTIVYTGTAASPLRLSASRVRTAVADTFSQDLSYIEFTSLPGAGAGRLYLGYSGYGTGTPAGTGTRYYASGTPSIDQLSFVPKGRYTGDATAAYTAYSTTGERMTGQITFRISAPSGSSYFSDLYGHTWAAASVDYLYQNGVTNGVTSTTYGPNQPILRRDFVLMLYRAFRFSGGSAASPGFADVPANAYYAQAVSAARQLGIVSGDGRNFMPDSQVTRQDAMVMIVNAMKAAGKLYSTASASVLSNFSDGALVSDYARTAVSTLVQLGAVNGTSGRLNPRASITRAEAAVILHFVMTA